MSDVVVFTRTATTSMYYTSSFLNSVKQRFNRG